MRIVVSGGGTGGHIYPALAVAECVRRLHPDAEILYIGSITGMETEIVPRYGVPFQAVTARKLRKVRSLSTIGVVISLLRGYAEARAHLRAFRPDAVLGTGGYVAAAAVLAGVRLRVPSLIVAPDVIPGRTNRLLARWADRICVAFPDTVSRFPAGRTVLTGMPLREGLRLAPSVSQDSARATFPGLCGARFTVLISGASQGAQALNRVVLKAAPGLLDAGIQILHQTGANNIAAVRQEAGSLIGRSGYCAVGFLDAGQLPLALRAADLIMCRGGISTLSENLVCGLPAMIVPLPTAYADHQSHNARAVAAAGAALVRAESELSPEVLHHDTVMLSEDPDRRQRMTRAALALAKPLAAESVVNELVALI